ncbi:uncharacterized protein LOC144913103 isoform X2 [Branchiostoma floridae x Branchiostoma belcheri]
MRRKTGIMTPMILVLLAAVVGVAVAGDVPCRPMQELYPSGKELCERMWDGAFVYETDLSRAYTMWFFERDNPNDKVSHKLGKTPPNKCYLQYLHKTVPGPEPDNFTECHPWKSRACCRQQTVSSPEKIIQNYGPEWRWDRCGKLSAACERFFVQEACFYECDPNAGLYRMYSDKDFDASNPRHNKWQIEGMPIRADYCDSWWAACRNDLFCAIEQGNHYVCAAEYEKADGQGYLYTLIKSIVSWFTQ